MIFTPTLARAVADGRKTQTRRIVKGDKPCRYKEGHDYAVQPGRGKQAITRLKVLEVREEPVGQVSHHDAKAEGFRNTAAFKAYWVRLYDREWAEEHEEETDAVIRFNARHAHRLVHVIRFELADVPRYLASQLDVLTGHTDDGEYTTNRARSIDQLEVIPPFVSDVERARRVGEQQRASFKRDLEVERARRKAATPWGQTRSQRGRSLRDAA